MLSFIFFISQIKYTMMKTYLHIIILITTMSGCTVQKSNAVVKKVPQAATYLKPEKNEMGEWDLAVLDTDWEYFLTAIAKPMDSYSESYLRNKNATLTSEWNAYYYSGNYKDVVESFIEYNPNENYGKKFQWKLYQVFAYANWKYGLKLNGLGPAEIYH